MVTAVIVRGGVTTMAHMNYGLGLLTRSRYIYICEHVIFRILTSLKQTNSHTKII